ncbi:catechol 2,3-dioxygenase-like lactoylglutathione lyase family enzyme [Nocardioides ginsengisegetis]|uniref:Catechol 2,3-dioxygenase-like lactoylglutathione lyase family enzyme n=1 Tax=Nocardioides ginsengisegetis TaxID=661491 RepID=A0A7W3J1D9_9ACTN|nr:VOC family protein [Nocardioides ginsengisegetis]MBA8804518.1 catechol 2,3-dioxygenase-like lactoylglutathione lyase family enzyme [Nocardioides ginsengisegetis]
MTSSLQAVVVDCRNPQAQAAFWAKVLGRTSVERNTDEYLVSDPARQATPLYFMKVPEPRVGKNRLHLDLVTEGALDDEVSRLMALGAHFVEVRQDPATLDNPDTWAVLEDPEGNVFCAASSSTVTGWA